MLLPLLKAIADAGGATDPRQVEDRLAEEFHVPQEVREQEAMFGGQKVNLFARRVRWVRQDAKRQSLLADDRRGIWRLSPKAEAILQNSRPGVCITIFETTNGTALWAQAETAAGLIKDSSLQLILTSPPYPLYALKSYGKIPSEADYLDWLVGLARQWKPLLVDDGSLCINLADTWVRGQPTLSLYQEELLLRLVRQEGFHFCQRFHWHSPTKIPASEWVTIRRVRVKTTTEQIFWLAKSPNPKVRQRRVLQPYSAKMIRDLARGGDSGGVRRRPGGHGSWGGFSRDNGGAIPSNLLTLHNARSRGAYFDYCRQNKIPLHPARFPEELPEFFINMLSDPGDLVYDPFFGSGTTGEVCERLGRAWLGSDRSKTYLEGARGRFLSNLVPPATP
jgi:site-specific DNA-methyltransferase (cytosine-N4-specific)